MVRQIEVKDNSIVKRAYKQQNEFNCIDSVYYILLDGSVIISRLSYKSAPNHKLIPGIEGSVGKFGGFCPNNDGGIMIGKQFNKGEEWEFECIECNYIKVYSDNKMDEMVFDCIFDLEEENKLGI